MSELTKEPTFYLAHESLDEDAADLAAFEKRIKEPLVSYETVLKGLKAVGRL